MKRYIDADKLKTEINKAFGNLSKYNKESFTDSPYTQGHLIGQKQAIEHILFIIDSLQQDEIQIDKMLCSQAWWEEQGWIMIPPNATIEGIDSLLKQVRKKLQQEQPGLPGIEESGIPGKDYIPVEWVDACEMYGKWKIVKQEQPEVDLENKFGWHNVSEETPKFGDYVIVACKNKNKEDGIWLYDFICWEGKWEPRENWETPLKWISVDELGLNARKED